MAIDSPEFEQIGNLITSHTPVKTERIISWLTQLVAFDTQNGTGDEVACAQFLKTALEPFKPDTLVLKTVPRARGKSDSAYVFASWGVPKLVLNVHIDTVPVATGWVTDAHTLTQKGVALYGLGSSDIKGAAACILAALEVCKPKDVAVLFSGDEEHGSEVMPVIIKSGLLKDTTQAIVCEPTHCEVGRRHRGMLAFSVKFSGRGGHSSLADVTERPLLDAARLASAIGDYGDQFKDFGVAPYKGLCTNIGFIKTDGAYNVIPTQTTLSFSMRPPPGDNVRARRTAVEGLYRDLGHTDSLDLLVELLPFQSRDIEAMGAYFGNLKVVDLPYWTEAALLSEAGINAVVFGPGDVEQAHKPNEHVEIAQLELAADVYRQALIGGPR